MPDSGSFLAAEGNEGTLARPRHAHDGNEDVGRAINVSIALIGNPRTVYRAALPSRKTLGSDD